METTIIEYLPRSLPIMMTSESARGRGAGSEEVKVCTVVMLPPYAVILLPRNWYGSCQNSGRVARPRVYLVIGDMTSRDITRAK